MYAPQRRNLEAAFPGAVKPVKLAHVVIRTSRFAESRAWWATVLAAEPAYENDTLSFLTYDDEHHRIGIISMPHLQPQDERNAGPEHIAFTYPDLGALLATYRRLKQAGIGPFWAVNHGPTVSFYYHDPDQTKVELQYDVFPTPEGIEAFFASGAYDENFVGVTFDPEAMITDYEAGRPLDEITRRPPLPDGMSPWDMYPLKR